MIEPQSTALFLLLLAAFAGLMLWAMMARGLAYRVVAACLAFVPAVVFGIAVVNKYYDYYQTWGAAIADFSGQSAPVSGVSGGVDGTGMTRVLGSEVYTSIAARDGATLRVVLRGSASHLTRAVYVYLPPQYFQPA